MVWNTVSATSACHLSEMTRGKFLYNSWSASVSLMPGKGRVDSVFESYVNCASKLPNQYYLLCTHSGCIPSTKLIVHRVHTSDSQLTFCVFFVEGANVKGVGRIDFPSRRNQRRRILLLVDHVPVDAVEERIVFQLLGATAATAYSFVCVSL